jgi:hypothetical protein
MTDRRCKNGNWQLNNLGNGNVSNGDAQLAVLMDIRDELQSLNRLANCYRIPRALDAMHEMGVDLRRKKRAAAKKRKAVRSK